MATGRHPVTAWLDLERVSVRTGALGEAVVDEQSRTTHPRIWAAGDVTGQAQLVYVAAAQGALVADAAFDGSRRSLDYASLPRVTFISPALASVGITTYAITEGMTVDQLAHPWAPYLTMGEALKLAAQSYTRDADKLFCCAQRITRHVTALTYPQAEAPIRRRRPQRAGRSARSRCAVGRC